MANNVSVNSTDLRKVIDYLYDDEKRSLDEMGGDCPGHILHVLDRLRKQMRSKPIVVAEVISAGELDIVKGTTQQSLIEQAGELLDAACSHEILGTVLFKAKDGTYYTMTTECIIDPASASFIKNTIADRKTASPRSPSPGRPS